MKVNVVWDGGLSFRGTGPSGHSVVMDASPEVGGDNRGPRPTEMLLFALGACTGIDTVSILNKSRQPVEGIEIDIEAERAEDHPKRFTRIRVHFTVRGKGLDRDRVERAITLSAEKYCSVGHSLNAEIETDFTITE